MTSGGGSGGSAGNARWRSRHGQARTAPPALRLAMFPPQEVMIEPSDLDVNTPDDANSKIFMHSNGYTSLCRQIEEEKDAHLSDEVWRNQLLAATDGTAGISEQLSEADRNLAAAFVHFVKQPLIDELGNIEKAVVDKNSADNSNSLLGNQLFKFYNNDDGDMVDVSSLHMLPSLHLLKRAQNSLWFNSKPFVEDSKIEVPSQLPPVKQQQSKKSLPHKKRISKKLKKNQPQNSQIVQEHDETNDVPPVIEMLHDEVAETFNSTNSHSLSSTGIVDNSVHVNRAVFICQICGDYYGEDQLKFYYHLKQHYEPHNASLILDSLHHDAAAISIDKINHTIGVESEALPDSLVDLSLDEAVSNKSLLYPTQNKIPEYDDKSIMNSALKSPLYSNEHKSVMDTSANKNIYFNDSPDDKIYNCNQCLKSFKRLKQFEAHIEDVHSSKVEEMSEFSEPEDLMEGIHVVVEPENDEFLQEDLSSQHSNPLIIHPLENQDQYILPHLTIENGQMVQQSHMPTKEWFVKQSDVQSSGNLNLTRSINIESPIQENLEKPKPELVNSDDMVICPLCGTIFSDRKEYDAHTQQYHLDLKEEELEKMMINEVDVSDTEPGEVPFKDSEPGEDSDGLGDDSDLFDKGKVSKSPRKILSCEECGKKFEHKNSLIYHMLTHDGKRLFSCKVCSKNFVTTSALKTHSRLHSGDRPYKCIECGRKFRQWGDLKYHFISIHSNVRQHQCEYCGKNFARKYSLIIHRRIHTGEKTYRCEYCDKTFRASSYLQSHRKIHTGEKPYPCTLCGKRFRMKGDMRRHLRIHNSKQATNDKDKEKLVNKITNLKELSVSSSATPLKTETVEENSNEHKAQEKEEVGLKEDIEHEDSSCEVKQLSDSPPTGVMPDDKNLAFPLDSHTYMTVWPALYIT